MPNITLNDEPKSVSSQTVAELLTFLGRDARKLAVEVNRMVIPRAEHGQTVLKEGDVVELVTLVGGG